MEQPDRQRGEILSGINWYQVSHKMVHSLIRLISIANSVNLAIEILAPEFGLSRLLNLQRQIANWYLVSSFGLPLYVAIETVWLRKHKLEFRAALIDALFAVGWFCLWWTALIATLYKTGFPWL